MRSIQFRILILALLAACMQHDVLAQENNSCNVFIKIIDVQGGDPLSNQSFILRTTKDQINDGIQFNTDKDGIIKLTLPKNTSQIILSGVNENLISLPEKFCDQLIFQLVSNEVNLNEVSVTGFLNESSKKSVPAAIGYIDQKILSATDRTSLQNSLNTIPGVSMESRGYGGSQRINIRGSALRAPFTIRNIKMYVDGIPLTTPDGQSPLELIDAFDIKSVEIIKGPSGSVWGSGNGGVLLFKSNHASPGKTSVHTSTQIGSYDLYRNATAINIGFKKGGLRFSHVYQDNKGYRQQEFNHKNQVSISGKHYLNSAHTLSHYHNYYNGRWGLPGALNPAESEINRRQANAFSHLINAHVQRERTMSGISHQWQINKKIKTNSSAYYYHTDKTNPFGTGLFSSGYKIESADGIGGRADIEFTDNITENIILSAHAGGEIQTENYNILEQKIVSAAPAGIRYRYDINYLSEQYYTTADIKFKDIVVFNAGVSVNKITQKIRGNTDTDFVYDTTATWGYQLLPRFALSVRINKNHYFYLSRSNGNSNPTVFEMVDYENNQFNLNLKPETGVNIEGGIKGTFSSIALDYELNVYRFTLKNAILAYNTIRTIDDSTSAEITLYNNLGSTTQNGLEWGLSKQFFGNTKNHLLRIFSNGSAFNYEFENYHINEENLTGKKIPGTPLVNLSSGIQYRFMNKFDLNIFHFYYDKTPLDNRNTNWSDPVHLINIKTGYNLVYKSLETNIYVGVNNLLDTDYSSFYNLNALNGRYFNPAPQVNFFCGLELKWQLK